MDYTENDTLYNVSNVRFGLEHNTEKAEMPANIPPASILPETPIYVRAYLGWCDDTPWQRRWLPPLGLVIVATGPTCLWRDRRALRSVATIADLALNMLKLRRTRFVSDKHQTTSKVITCCNLGGWFSKKVTPWKNMFYWTVFRRTHGWRPWSICMKFLFSLQFSLHSGIFAQNYCIFVRHRCTTQLAKVRSNHSIRRTHSWRFFIFSTMNALWKPSTIWYCPHTCVKKLSNIFFFPA